MLRSFSLLMLSSLTLAATFTSAQAPAPAAKPKVSSTLAVRKPGDWKLLDSGIEHRKMTLERSDPSYSFDLNLVRFGRQRVLARIISSGQFQLKSADAKTLAQRSGAVATINANYFDEKGKPLAFLKTANQEINRSVSKHALYTGVFGVQDSTPFIVHRDEFQLTDAQEADSERTAAIEAGGGRAKYPGRGPIQPARGNRHGQAAASYRRRYRYRSWRVEFCRTARTVFPAGMATGDDGIVESRRRRISSALHQDQEP